MKPGCETTRRCRNACRGRARLSERATERSNLARDFANLTAAIARQWTARSDGPYHWATRLRLASLCPARGFLFALLFNHALLAIDSPVPPEAAHETFQLDDGLVLELVAAEPLTASPVALAWDDDGRLFVVENRGYPTGLPDGSNGGVIARLEDTDHDGRMDRRTVFADGFTFPNGILAWGGGFFVTCAPDVFFLKDTDGDGRADVRQVVLTGFDTSNSTQLRVAHPTLGPDGWIYLTSGLTRAGDITSPWHPDRPAVRIGSDSRFDPFTFEIEPVDGRGQFGQTFDDWGNRFHNMNRVHIQHTVLPSRFLERNPDFAFTETVQNVPEGMIDDLLKSRNVAARIYPISDNFTTADSHAGTFSAACSVHVYRGNGLPVDYYGDVFTCEPTGNLVHRDRLTPVGPTFSSRMVNEGREFLASRDNWFRPVFLATGPDGALYVADMYRGTIEHPDYLPEEVRKRTDFESGRERGRIWRITSKTGRSRRAEAPLNAERGVLNAELKSAPPYVGSYKVEQLIADLGHPNGWQRERAMKLMLANRMTNALPALQQALMSRADSEGSDPLLSSAREAGVPRRDLEAVRAVNLLNTFASLVRFEARRLEPGTDRRFAPVSGRELLRRTVAATVHHRAGVRIAAWLSLRELKSDNPGFPDALVDFWTAEPNPAARFHMLLALGNWKNENAGRALANVGLKHGGDKWMRAAFVSGLHDRAFEISDRTFPDGEVPSPELGYELGLYLGKLLRAASASEPSQAILSADWPEPEIEWQITSLAGHIDGWGLRELKRAGTPPLRGLGYGAAAEVQIKAQAQLLMNASSASLIARRSAATALALTADDGGLALLEHVGPDTSAQLAHHVLALVFQFGEQPVLERLLVEPFWPALPPTARAQVIDGLLQRAGTAELLLRSLQAGRVQPTTLSLDQRDRLHRQLPAGLQEAAAVLFTSASGDRRQVYEQFKEVAARSGDAIQGRALFQQHCAACHRLDRTGFNVGPDLFGIRSQSKEAILLHVLVPNAEVYPEFAAVTLETRDDRSLTGIVRAEMADALTLVQAQGLVTTLRRDEITSRRTADTSLMPDGFEQVLSRQELADLLAALRGE